MFPLAACSERGNDATPDDGTAGGEDVAVADAGPDIPGDDLRAEDYRDIEAGGDPDAAGDGDAPEEAGDAGEEGEGPRVPCVVNGHTASVTACSWLHHTARAVVPLLEGTRDERLTAAARVAWWSLKEGVLYLANPIVYSNCGAPGRGRIGPLETCPGGYAWQVGLAGIQVPGFELADLETAALRLFPGKTVAEVLDAAAREALLDATGAAAVVASTGSLRRSWLLRTSAVGFTFQAPIVTDECIDHSIGWCYGTGWDTTRWFAPDRASAMRAIEDVRAILAAVAP